MVKITLGHGRPRWYKNMHVKKDEDGISPVFYVLEIACDGDVIEFLWFSSG